MCVQRLTHNYKLPPEVVMLNKRKDILLIVIMNPGDQTKTLNLDFIA